MTLSGNTYIERHWLAFILVALFFRWGYVEFRVSELRPADIPGRWYFYTPDSHSYVDPIESIVAGGNFYPDYRMPGVGVSYWVFRQFWDRDASLDAMVLLQCVLSGISVYLLALLGLRLTGSHVTAMVLYVLFLLSTYSSWHDTSISSDSLAISVMVIHVFLLQRSSDHQSNWMLVAAGLFFTWFIFLRPVAALLLFPVSILLFMHWGPVRLVKTVLFFMLPFMVIDGVWLVRNWRAHGGFNPLTNEGIMPEEIAGRPRGYLMRFIQGYGGNYIWWEAGADIRWFGEWNGSGEIDNEGRNAKEPPDYAYVPGYTKDSLFALSEQIRRIESGSLSPADSIATVSVVNSALGRYAHLYEQGAPFNYHILSRIRPIKYMIAQNGAETLFHQPFGQLPLWKQLFKLFQIFVFQFAFIIGGIAVVVGLWRWRRTTLLLSIWVPVVISYMVLIYPIGLRMGEMRYMVHVFPLALLLATCFAMTQVSALRARWLEG